MARGVRGWYIGAGVSLVWLIAIGQDVTAAASTPTESALGIALLALFGLGFLASLPVARALDRRARVLVPLALLALSFTLFPWLGWHVSMMWTYVGVTFAMTVSVWWLTYGLIVALGLCALLSGAAVSGWTQGVFWYPLIIVSISFMMAGFARSLAAITELRAAQRQLEHAAAERERLRVARDIHDVLGHSLTVISVKSELAERLLDRDLDRARAEIADVQTLARAALADVRATVAGVRAVTVSGELAAARLALEAAGIAGELPGSTEAVASDRRELAGWVLREGITNVVRHSKAAAAACVCPSTRSRSPTTASGRGRGPRRPLD